MARGAVGVEDLFSGSNITGEGGGDGDSDSYGGTGDGCLDGLRFLIVRGYGHEDFVSRKWNVFTNTQQKLKFPFQKKLTAGTSKCLGTVHADAEAIRAATMVSFIVLVVDGKVVKGII
jgi:hypothetical protein